MGHMNKGENPFLNPDSPAPVVRRQSDSSRTRKRADSGVYKVSRAETAAKLETAIDEGHPLIARYQPSFVGKGGEHVVYDVAGSPDVVVKAEMRALAEVLSSEDQPRALEQVRERLAEQRRLFEVLKRHFGAEHVLPHMKTLMKVPLTEVLIEEVGKRFGVKVPQVTREAWTIVTIQRRMQEVEPWEKQSLSIGDYIDDREMKNFAQEGVFDEYATYTDQFMSAETAEKASISSLGFEKFIKGSEMERFLREMDFDSSFKDAVRDFCERAVAFAEETGEILDLIGSDNVVFFKDEDGKWTYKLLDPFYGLESQILKRGQLAFMQMGSGEEPDHSLANGLMQSINFTRVINAIGRLAGSKKFYDFLPAKDGKPPALADAMRFLVTGGKRKVQMEQSQVTKKRESSPPRSNAEAVTRRL